MSGSELLQQADHLHASKKFAEVFELLSAAEKQSPDFEVLWRLARAYFDVADEKPNDPTWKKNNYSKGLEVAQRSLQLNAEHFAPHKWVAILLSSYGDFVSTKEKVGNAFKIKEHALKALEYKPDDATTNHLLGRWCFGVASVGWIERKVATVLFATPPESTYEEALKYLLRANELEVDFMRNVLCIGDTYTALKQNDNAKIWYQKTLDLPAKCEADKAMHQEAKTKLGKL